MVTGERYSRKTVIAQENSIAKSGGEITILVSIWVFLILKKREAEFQT